MQKSAAPTRPEPAARLVALALAGVAGLTLWRVAMLALSRADLYVDEAQYWFWSESLAFGYFSKPPLIAWLIRLSTELAGSAEAFWVRLPAPLLHAAAALAVGAVGAAFYDRRVGALSALAYATMPAVALGSAVISTDTPLLLATALALLAWRRLVARPSDGAAAAFGLAVGVGFLAKYAALYIPLCAALAALDPRFRMPWRAAAVAAGVCALLVAPNLIWNVVNGFVTLSHTAHNADAAGGFALRPGKLAEFFGAQFGVFGPVLFGGLLWAAWDAARRRPAAAADAALLWFSVPILALVSLQALRSGANANWAAAAYAAATPVVVAKLSRAAPRALTASFAVNLAACVAVPLAMAAPESLPWPGSRSPLARVTGRAAFAEAAAATAAAEGLSMIVAGNRGLLADFAHALRDAPVAVRAVPPEGAPRHHFEMAMPYRDGEGPALFVGFEAGSPPALPGLRATGPVVVWRPDTGAHQRRALAAWRMEIER